MFQGGRDSFFFFPREEMWRGERGFFRPSDWRDDGVFDCFWKKGVRKNARLKLFFVSRIRGDGFVGGGRGGRECFDSIRSILNSFPNARFPLERFSPRHPSSSLPSLHVPVPLSLSNPVPCFPDLAIPPLSF